MKKGKHKYLVALSMPDSRTFLKFSNRGPDNPCNVWHVHVMAHAKKPAIINDDVDRSQHNLYQRMGTSAKEILRNELNAGAELIEISIDRSDLSFLSHPAIMNRMLSHCAGSPLKYDVIILNDIGLTSMTGCPTELETLDLGSNSITTIDAAPKIAKCVNLSNNPISGFSDDVLIETVESLELNNTRLTDFHGVVKHVKSITVGLTICTTRELSNDELTTLDDHDAEPYKMNPGSRPTVGVTPVGGILRLLDVLNAGNSAPLDRAAFLMLGRPTTLRMDKIGAILSTHDRDSSILDGAARIKIEQIIEDGARDIHLAGENRRRAYMLARYKLQELGFERLM